MKRVVLSIAVAVWVLVTVLSAIGCAHVTYEEEYQLHGGRKAIIILPGLLASGLYDEETGDALWDPVQSDNVDLLEFMGVYDETHKNVTVEAMMPEIWDLMDYFDAVMQDVVEDDGSFDPNNIMRRIMCDDKGDAPAHVVGVPVGYEGHLQYGALNSYKWWAEGLEELYGDEYEVVVFNYNWLTDTRYAARDFQAFMRENNYTDTILIGHSMGGIVATEYMAMGAENRARVDKFIAVAVPFYGSYMATDVFENPLSYLELINYMLDTNVPAEEGMMGTVIESVVAQLKGGINDLFYGLIMPFLYNMKSVYQLLPSGELMTLQASVEGEGSWQDGQRVRSDGVFEWYSSRPFVTDTPLATAAEAKDRAMRAIFRDWQEYRDGFYVDKAEGKVFACDLVDTYYVVGTGVTTDVGISIDGETRRMHSNKQGDGTVPLLSATRGRPLSDSHVYAVEGMTHIPMGTLWYGGQKAAVLEILGGNK